MFSRLINFSDEPIFPRLWKISPTLYRRAVNYRFRLLTRWHWWRARRPGGKPFLPAVRAFKFTTRSYFQHSRPIQEGKETTYITIRPAHYIPPPDPKTLGHDIFSTRIKSIALPIFAAHLRNATAYGEPGDVITDDGTLLADVSYLNPSDLCFKRHRHSLIESDPLPEPTRLKGTYALLTSLVGGSNYFHWLFSVLPRLAILERAGVNLASIDAFLVNHLRFPYVQRHMLSVVGIQPERVVEMAETDAYHLQELWVTSNLHFTGHRHRWLCDWLREKFLVLPPPKVPSRRLYLSRADASSRRVSNEDEVMHFLAPFGFDKVVIGRRSSVFEQSALFANAEIVVGPQTATFGNILFCSPGTRIIEMVPGARYYAAFWELSACMGLNYYYAITEWLASPYPTGFGDGDTTMRLDGLASILRLAGVT